MQRLSSITILLGIFFIGIFNISADVAAKPITELNKDIREQQAAELGEKINLARKLMTERNYQGASAMLEVLYEEHPTNSTIISTLINCYDNMKLYAKAETLIRRQIEQFPANYYYHYSLAEFLLKQNMYNEAEKAYADAIALIQDNNINRYLSLVRSMINYGADNLAQRLIDSVRILNNDTNLFAVEMGGIYEARKLYDKATYEYLKVIDDSTNNAIKVESRLLSLLEFEESSKITEKVLSPLANTNISPRLSKLLSAYYLKSYRFDEAFRFAVKLDSLEKGKGTILREYLMSCRDCKLYHEAARMGSYIINHSVKESIHPDVYFLYADALTNVKQYDKAISIYDLIVAQSPQIQNKAEAVYSIGQIYAERMHQYETALMLYDSVINNYRGGLGYFKTQMAKPQCYLKMGDLKKTEEEYKFLLDRRLDENSKEEVDYYLTLLRFFNKQYDSTKAGLQRVMLNYPKGFYVNDALQILLVIDEAEGDEELLYIYSNALMFETQNRLDSSAVKLKQLIDHNNKTLADNALFKLVNLNLKQADTTTAIESIDMMEAKFSGSYYLPYCLKFKADIFMTDDKRLEKAQEIYKRLLEQYPNYPFSSHVRKILRELNQEKPVG